MRFSRLHQSVSFLFTTVLIIFCILAVTSVASTSSSPNPFMDKDNDSSNTKAKTESNDNNNVPHSISTASSFVEEQLNSIGSSSIAAGGIEHPAVAARHAARMRLLGHIESYLNQRHALRGESTIDQSISAAEGESDQNGDNDDDEQTETNGDATDSDDNLQQDNNNQDSPDSSSLPRSKSREYRFASATATTTTSEAPTESGYLLPPATTSPTLNPVAQPSLATTTPAPLPLAPSQAPAPAVHYYPYPSVAHYAAPSFAGVAGVPHVYHHGQYPAGAGQVVYPPSSLAQAQGGPVGGQGVVIEPSVHYGPGPVLNADYNPLVSHVSGPYKHGYAYAYHQYVPQQFVAARPAPVFG